MLDLKVLHVMRALHVVVNVALTRTAECLDRIELVLLYHNKLANAIDQRNTHLHFRLLSTLDYRNSFACVNTVLTDLVTIQIPYGFH
jgi:hypothetical protein